MTSPSFDSSLATLSNSVFSTQPSLFTSNSLRIHYIVTVRYYYFDEGDQSLQYTNLYMSFRFSTAVPVFIVLSATMNSLNWKKWQMGWAEMPNITWKISDHRDRCHRSSKCKRQGHRIQRRDMTGSAKHWGWQGKYYRLQDPRYSWQEDIGKRLHCEQGELCTSPSPSLQRGVTEENAYNSPALEKSLRNCFSSISFIYCARTLTCLNLVLAEFSLVHLQHKTHQELN